MCFIMVWTRRVRMLNSSTSVSIFRRRRMNRFAEGSSFVFESGVRRLDEQNAEKFFSVLFGSDARGYSSCAASGR